MRNQVCVGAIAGAFGVKGEVRLKSFTATPEDIAAYGKLNTEDGSRSFDVCLTGRAKGTLVARLSGIMNKEAAAALRGERLYVARDRLPETEEGEYYHADLVGLEVYDTGGTLLGKVKAVLNHGASDLLDVQLNGSSDTALLPFTLDVVPTVDLAASRLIADPPEGVFQD